MRQWVIILTLAVCWSNAISAGTRSQDHGTEFKTSAAAWLKTNPPYMRCDEEHYIYGVGYIDGSYMERIFYVRGGGDQLSLKVRFRDEDPAASDAQLRFVLEVRISEALSADPSGDEWRLNNEGWQSALRFKYTSWFGTIAHEEGKWRVTWQGYRRPMLPPGFEARSEAICGIFAGR